MASIETRRWSANLGAHSRRGRQACEYGVYLPDLLQGWETNVGGQQMADLADAERAILELNQPLNRVRAGSQPAGQGGNLEGIARFLLRAESVGSSKIEGLNISAKRLARHEAAIANRQPSSDQVAAEILANVAQMDGAIDVAGNLRGPLTVVDICALHRTLMAGSPDPELGGQIRTQQNWIGGNDFNPCAAAYVPPPPERVEPLLEDLVAYINEDAHPALMQAALAHAQFETIHPFVDGNGRTGRALVHLVLRRRGLAPRFVPPISLTLGTWAKSYVSALNTFRHTGAADSPERNRSIVDVLQLFAEAALRACEGSKGYSIRIAALQQRWATALGKVRAGSAVAALIGRLPGAPVLTSESAAKIINRSRPATSNAIKKLVEAGILQQRNLGKQRYRVYEASEVLELYDSLERVLAIPDANTQARPSRLVPALT